MQLVGLCRQLHYRGVFIIFLIWRLFVDSTQKAVKNQEICEPLQGNLGITQSSGLDRLSGYPDNLSKKVIVITTQIVRIARPIRLRT